MLYTLEQLSNGEVACENDGILEQLEAVLKHCFPKDGSSVTGYSNYYSMSKRLKGSWKSNNEDKLPTQSVKEFYKQLQPQFEVGKWYQLKDECLYIKYSKSNKNYIYSDEVVNTATESYRSIKDEFWIKGKSRIWVLCEDLSEIQPFLPPNHPDKIKTMKTQYLTRKQLIELYKADNCPEWKMVIAEILEENLLSLNDDKIQIYSRFIDLANQKCSQKQKELLTKAGLILTNEIAVCDSKDGDCIKVGNHYFVNKMNNIGVFQIKDYKELRFSYTDKRNSFSPDIKGTLVKEPLSLQIKIN
jgi:hypothetical protein